MNWNLRRVRAEKSSCECCPPASHIRVYEVYYDEQGRPWSYADASLVDKIRLLKDWYRSPILRWPGDFTGEPSWLKELGDLL